MTQYPPKTFCLQRIFQAIEVVLQNTRIQTRGPNAEGGGGKGYFHRDYKRIEAASGDESRNKLNKSNGGQI